LHLIAAAILCTQNEYGEADTPATLYPRFVMKTLQVETRDAWRAWLAEHHTSESEIWLIFHKAHTGKENVSYDETVEEALCFGWIDSLIKRLDDDRYARKFTPRRSGSVMV